MSERNVAVSTDDHGLGRARHPTRHVVVHENGRDAGQDGACLDAEVGHHEASRRKPCEFIAHQGGPCRLAAPDDSDVGRPMACPGEGTSEDGACRQAVGIIVAEDRRSVRSGSGDGASKGCSVYGEIGHARSLSHMHGPSPVRRDRRDRHADPRGGAPLNVRRRWPFRTPAAFRRGASPGSGSARGLTWHTGGLATMPSSAWPQ